MTIDHHLLIARAQWYPHLIVQRCVICQKAAVQRIDKWLGSHRHRASKRSPVAYVT